MTRQGKSVFPAALVLAALLVFLGLCAVLPNASGEFGWTLRIRDWKTGAIYAEVPVRPGSRLFFGWIHSLEKIPWNEYYHVDEHRRLILDTITFPAFGAGIPEDKGRVCYVKNGLIYMEEIDQVFEELVWLNSHTATRDILIDNSLVARGESLPHHVRVRLAVEGDESNGSDETK